MALGRRGGRWGRCRDPGCKRSLTRARSDRLRAASTRRRAGRIRSPAPVGAALRSPMVAPCISQSGGARALIRRGGEVGSPRGARTAFTRSECPYYEQHRPPGVDEVQWPLWVVSRHSVNRQRSFLGAAPLQAINARLWPISARPTSRSVLPLEPWPKAAAELPRPGLIGYWRPRRRLDRTQQGALSWQQASDCARPDHPIL